MNKPYSEEWFAKIVASVLKELDRQNKTIKIIGEASFAEKQSIMASTETIEAQLFPDVLYITQLPVTMMGRLVQMAPMNELEEEILGHLLDEKQVLVNKNGVAALNLSGKTHLFRKAKEIYRDFLMMGAEEVSETRNTATKRRILYTEEKIKELVKKNGTTISVDKNAIFTELAKDFIRQGKIELVSEDKGGAL